MNLSLLVSFLTAAAFSPRLRLVDRGPSRISYRARLNRAVYSSAGRVTFRSLEMEQARMLADRRIRCEVYAENNPQ